jgi:hypothetical protein
MRLVPGNEDRRRRVTVEQAEADYLEGAAQSIRSAENDDSRRETLQKPFGFVNEEWEELKSMMQPGDELWEYCTSKESWNMLMGSAGIELIRNGEVIASFLIRMN